MTRRDAAVVVAATSLVDAPREGLLGVVALRDISEVADLHEASTRRGWTELLGRHASAPPRRSGWSRRP